MAHQANATSRAIAPGGDPSTLAAGGARTGVSAAAGRKGFKAGLDDVRERVRSLGLGYDEIAAEVAHRHRLRPRESYRLAWGWTQGHAAERFNALAAQQGTEPQAAHAGMTGPHLCEVEKWPDSSRRPSVYVLLTLARMYQTDILRLLDLADHESLAPEDWLALLRPQPRAVGFPGGSLVTVEGERDQADVRGVSLPMVLTLAGACREAAT